MPIHGAPGDAEHRRQPPHSQSIDTVLGYDLQPGVEQAIPTQGGPILRWVDLDPAFVRRPVVDGGAGPEAEVTIPKAYLDQGCRFAGRRAEGAF